MLDMISRTADKRAGTRKEYVFKGTVKGVETGYREKKDRSRVRRKEKERMQTERK